jgi:aldose 1-epimerase
MIILLKISHIFPSEFCHKFTGQTRAMKLKLFITHSTLYALSSLLIASCSQPAVNKTTSSTMITINKTIFGQIENKEVDLYTISGKNMMVKITNFGGIVTSIQVPDKNGRMEDVVLGFDNLQDYLKEHPYFGCLVGRYANRIAKGRFELDGVTYQLAVNNGENHLHGGLKGFDKNIWDAKEYREGDEAGVELTYTSRDMEENYPGNLKVKVIYTINPSNELKIRYFAETDKATPVNLTYHGYFNLKGAGNGDILDQELRIDADRYTVVNDQLIPTGELRDVTGTPFDFRQFKPIGRDMAGVVGGFDHNFVLNNKGTYSRVAALKDVSSGRLMEVYTDQPGIQFYGGNFLDGSLTGKGGKPYKWHYGLCLETQHFPDSPNHPDFPNTILRPGEVFKSVTVYSFMVCN